MPSTSTSLSPTLALTLTPSDPERLRPEPTSSEQLLRTHLDCFFLELHLLCLGLLLGFESTDIIEVLALVSLPLGELRLFGPLDGHRILRRFGLEVFQIKVSGRNPPLPLTPSPDPQGARFGSRSRLDVGQRGTHLDGLLLGLHLLCLCALLVLDDVHIIDAGAPVCFALRHFLFLRPCNSHRVLRRFALKSAAQTMSGDGRRW